MSSAISLESQWYRLASHLPQPMDGDQSAACFSDLSMAYGWPTRAYHNLDHVDHCLREAAAMFSDLSDEDSIALQCALWFHDAIYDPRTAEDDEEASACFAREMLATQSKAILDKVERLILATKHNASPSAPLEAAMIDTDLAILGQSQQAYDTYAKHIRQEYAHVPSESFRVGRRAVLSRFLDRPTIYHTHQFLGAYETRARDNLRREWESLA